MLSSETWADGPFLKRVVNLHHNTSWVTFCNQATDSCFAMSSDKQATFTVTLRSKNAFSVKLRPLNISVRKRVWELSSMTDAADRSIRHLCGVYEYRCIRSNHLLLVTLEPLFESVHILEPQKRRQLERSLRYMLYSLATGVKQPA